MHSPHAIGLTTWDPRCTEIASTNLSVDKQAGSKPSPSLLWSTSDGVLGIDDAMFANLHTRADKDTKARLSEHAPLHVDHRSVLISERLGVACQTDPPPPVSTSKLARSSWLSPPTLRHIVPAIEITAASAT